MMLLGELSFHEQIHRLRKTAGILGFRNFAKRPGTLALAYSVCQGKVIDDDCLGNAALRQAAKRADGLRTFSYRGDVEETSVFATIATQAPLLETVFVGLRPYETEDGRLANVVRSFALCPNLRDLEVDTFEDRVLFVDEIDDIVRRLRLNGARCKLERVCVENFDCLSNT